MLQIKEIRENNNITQQQLADASKLNIRWIQKVESGEISLENITIKNMALLLNGLSSLIPEDKFLEEDHATLRSAYIVVRSLLSENDPV